MLEIKNINKYFNRHKKNEIHVIDNTTLSLDSTGLVALLGQSGSGKTTLLNVIGGLDKISSGKIYVNKERISSRFSSRVDKIRNLNIGYIFQDYKLIDNLSVYDNVKMPLVMIGLKDKKEIDKRVCYVLEKVGMLRYKKRPCSMLSGGERQRVGIARAIVKNPNIILADEPTGNLDSKNSLEIMKIIKAISKDRLVILVTHEQNLARFYASRIIELEDGKIVRDYPNDNNLELDYEVDNTFYLKDYNLDSSSKGINIYKKNNEKINLDLVIKGDNIYIRSNNNFKVTVVDSSSNIEFIDDYYKKVVKEDIDKYKFDFKDIINDDFKKKYTGILNPFTLLISGFKKVFGYSFLKKMLLIGFFLSGLFIMYSCSSIARIYKIDESSFITMNKNYLIVNQKNIKVDDYLSYETRDNVNYILPSNSITSFKVSYRDYYQTVSAKDVLSGSLSSIDMISSNDLLYGSMPNNNQEIVVDKLALTKMFEDTKYAKMSGVINVNDMIGRVVNIDNMPDFTIVGITDLGSPSIYVDNSNFINILSLSGKEESSMLDYNLFTSDVTLKEGRAPSNDYEVIVNIKNKDDMKLNKPISTKVNDTALTVVGYYTSSYDYNYLLVNNNTIKYDLIGSSDGFVIYAKDKDSVLNDFRGMNLNISDSYTSSRDNYKKQMAEYNKNTLVASIIILAISLIEIFLMVRSSFLSKIKEVGIYRAVGCKKSDIYKMFLGEIVAVTTLGSVPGIAMMAYVLYKLSLTPYFKSFCYVDSFVVIIAILCVFIFNIIVGLLPVFNTIRKSPAQILARHDLD